jgi:hypothetical protein
MFARFRTRSEPLPAPPSQMDDLVKRETAANMEVIKEAGIKQ